MDTSRRTLMGSILVIVGLVGLAALVVVSVVLAGDDDPEPEPEVTAPEPAPPEEEEEEPPPEPVEGEAELLGVRDLSASGTGLVGSGSGDNAPVEIDDRAVESLLEDVTAWLDEHLTQLQDGHGGLVSDAGVTGPDGIADLAGPADPVSSATYDVVIGARGEPEWAEVTMRVTGQDGSEGAARLVFNADSELLAVEELG